MGLRIAAVEAIRGMTLVGDRVLDSEIAALSADADGSIRTDQEKPFVAVYTDDGEATGIDGLYDGGFVDVVFEAGIAASMTVTDPDTGASEVYAGIPATDRAFEVHADFVCRQIVDALSDRENAWADVWRGLTVRRVKTRRRRASSVERSARLAAAQLTITVASIDDPARGVPIDPALPFGKLLALMEASADGVLTATAALIRAHLAGDREPWRTVQEQLGLSSAALAVLGLGPLAWMIGEDDETPPTEASSIEIEGRPSEQIEAE